MRDVLIVPPKHSWLVTGGRHFRALFRFFERPKVVSAEVYSESFFLQTSAAIVDVVSFEITTGTEPEALRKMIK